MGERQWLHEFNTQNRIRVHFVTEKGQVIQLLIVQYEALIGDKWHAVVRYDQAHGFLHRDLLSPGGKQKKLVISDDDLTTVLTEAVEDIKRHWPQYRQQFEEELK